MRFRISPDYSEAIVQVGAPKIPNTQDLTDCCRPCCAGRCILSFDPVNLGLPRLFSLFQFYLRCPQFPQAIPQGEILLSYNKHGWGTVFLFEVCVDEVTVENAHGIRRRSVNLRRF